MVNEELCNESLEELIERAKEIIKKREASFLLSLSVSFYPGYNIGYFGPPIPYNPTP